MYKAKALIGEKAGEFVYAKDYDLTHDSCRLWKLYCPECKQFLYFSKSKQPENRRSYFGHYDYEDKRCPERVLLINQKSQPASLSESHEQDLETAESFVEQVFYGIDPEFFQRQNSEGIEDSSNLIRSSIEWLRENLQYKCHDWINHYCRTIGFLAWESPSKEAGYLMDWLYVLVRRDEILKNITRYFISTYLAAEFDIDIIQSKLGIFDSNEKEEGLIWFIALEQIIEHLSIIARDGVPNDTVLTVSLKTFIEFKIPPNEKKTPFRGKASLGAMSIMNNFYSSRRCPNQAMIPINGYKDCIFFRKTLVNRFLCISWDECKSITGDLPEEDFLFFYIDADDNLSVKGFAEKRYRKRISGGISTILFNKTDCSMLFFLMKGFISKDIAAKSAQLALKSTHGDLSPSEALEKFRVLSGDKPGHFWGF
jgi:uncharacterized protein YbaR (Trm112 family)